MGIKQDLCSVATIFFFFYCLLFPPSSLNSHLTLIFLPTQFLCVNRRLSAFIPILNVLRNVSITTFRSGLVDWIKTHL